MMFFEIIKLAQSLLETVFQLKEVLMEVRYHKQIIAHTLSVHLSIPNTQVTDTPTFSKLMHREKSSGREN